MIRVGFGCYQTYLSLSGGKLDTETVISSLACVPEYLLNQNIIWPKVFIDVYVHVSRKMDL